MKKIVIFLALVMTQIVIAHATSKIVVCTLQGLDETISFTPPAKIGQLPKLDFSYPVDTTIFSMRDGNLLLVAMDHEDSTRPRIFISAQAWENSLYKGQFMTDSGGNQMQLDNGFVSCKAE
ncbi:hypothetical protein [Legionella cardiaca]|uniref:C-type lysozyme inhibitor domain-containing protein n=1 Tax=Legionella cardiaca TaxID=1071983 RepID=A0ABY8AV41_9GAMM|nr:hypothetical protein [Legionella cardiaca]WED44567.1 hypothetical protein PXX05_07205 [Legionella cardiaca]